MGTLVLVADTNSLLSRFLLNPVARWQRRGDTLKGVRYDKKCDVYVAHLQ